MNTDIKALNHAFSNTPAEVINALNEILEVNNKPRLKPNPRFETVVKAIKDLRLDLQVTAKA